MTLATMTAEGRPAVRVVVLAGFDARGFDFTTDGRSPKAGELRRQPWAALAFLWPELERQVRVEGPVETLAEAEADAYFHKRARESQLAAWLAPQSQVVASRAVLEEGLLQVLARYDGRPVPRPPEYTGYRVAPATLEFWQARSDHIHDRLRYRRAPDGAWIIELLAP
jgi:pyridoxamine 5'-phosphate oxidase